MLSGAELAKVEPVAVKAPATTSPTNAPEVSVSAGTSVAAVVKGLPASTRLKASMSVAYTGRAKESFAPIGETRSTADGRAQVPAFKASRAGVYTIRLTTPSGKGYYLKVKVVAKKSSKPETRARTFRDMGLGVNA
jgi:hypothetical protein